MEGKKGTYAKEYFNRPIRRSIESRLPWLIVGLIGMTLSAQFISAFKHILEQELVLAYFLPMIVYMADAIGTETETIFVRDIALDTGFKVRRFLVTELRTGLSISIICGLLTAAYSYLRFQSVYLGLVLAVSLFMATLAAILVGAFVPWAVNKMHRDPAEAVGPLTTVLQDMFSVISYFVVASLLLKILN